MGKGAWKFRNEIGSNLGNGIYKSDFNAMTETVIVDLEIGKERKLKEFEDEELLKRFKDKYELKEDFKVIYTDGSFSKETRSTGIGISREDSEIAYKLSINNKCSSYTAEVIAIKKALGMALELGWSNDLLIDCQATCKDILCNKIKIKKHSAVIRIREKIRLYKDNCKDRNKTNNVPKVIIGWIPSHVGIKGNEIVVQLAKEASQEEADEKIEMPIGDWKRIYKEEMYARTKRRNETEGEYKGRYYFDTHHKKESTKPWFKKLDVKRGIATIINRLRANHYNLNESLARKGYIESAECECGAEYQNVQHVVMRCSQYDGERSKLYRELETMEAEYPYEIYRWLQGPRVCSARELYMMAL